MSKNSYGMSMTKDFTFDNLNAAKLIWDRKKDPRRFGQFWMGQTGFNLPEDFRPGYNLWEEKDADIAYGVIFDYIQTIHQI